MQINWLNPFAFWFLNLGLVSAAVAAVSWSFIAVVGLILGLTVPVSWMAFSIRVHRKPKSFPILKMESEVGIYSTFLFGMPIFIFTLNANLQYNNYCFPILSGSIIIGMFGILLSRLPLSRLLKGSDSDV